MKMEYKRSFAGEIIAIVVVIIGSIAFLSIQQEQTSPEDAMGRVSQMREENRMSERPVTASDLERRLKIAGFTEMSGKSPEEYQVRLERMADSYNRELESDQASIRREREEKQARDNQMTTYTVLIAGVLISAFGISAIVKAKQPAALVISDDKLDIKASVFQDVDHIDLSRIKQIQYEINVYRREGADYTERLLHFIDAQGTRLGKINLNILDNADFNDIQKEISRQAPHIEWIYPR